MKRERCDSAEVAKRRLQFILAFDRAKMDGRERIARLYSAGNRILFDQPLTILPDESLVMDYTLTTEGIVGHAIICKTYDGGEE